MLKLTMLQKLEAVSLKYYSNFKWEPKLNDYYTLTRQALGLEIFQIVEENSVEFGIKLVWDEHGNYELEQPITYFNKHTFVDSDFGKNRIYLYNHSLKNR